MAKVSTIVEMDLVGGAACIDFVNTALNDKLPVERLHGYSDLLILNRRLSLLDADTLAGLEQTAELDQEQAKRVLLKAREVRQAILAVFSALISDQPEQINASMLKLFNRHINEALGERGFSVQNKKLSLTWKCPRESLMQAVWVFSLSAYELLTTKDQRLIKQCGACDWFFLDETKNHRRKWCDMQTCGTNQKARRYYQRHKQASLGEGELSA